MNKKTIFRLATLAAIVAGSASLYFVNDSTQQGKEWVLGQGDVDTLKSVYNRWQQAYESRGGNAAKLRLPLANSKALSEHATAARGSLELDLIDGSVSVTVKGLGQNEYDVWLVDNREGDGRSIKPERGDGMLRLGKLEQVGDHGSLKTRIDRDTVKDFKLDLAVVTDAGKTPDQGTLLTGAPGLFERLYYSDKPWAMTKVGEMPAIAQTQTTPFDFLLPTLAHAKNGNSNQDLEAVLGQQIAKGRDLFLNETFNGNGRTCGTCHRPDNNHTIDPEYIAKLPKNDPLFVGENPKSRLHELENWKLLRKFGLVKANMDGFDKPGVLRSVPATLGLPTSIAVEWCKELHPDPEPGEPPLARPNKGEFCEDEDFAHAVGWSGDGSPGSGSLLEFTLGAIIQHMPKTLNRLEGVDFTLPEDNELAAVEAYMLSLGRQQDIKLANLTFTSPLVEAGKLLFDTKENMCRLIDRTDSTKPEFKTQNNRQDPETEPPCPDGYELVMGDTANCNGCHSNAGANSSTTLANPTRDTGFENMPDQPARLMDPTIPVDGGFGNQERKNCGPDQDQTCYGDGRFNTPSLLEAADTAPFFHNHSAATIEDAVLLYTNPAFNNSPGALTSSKHDRQVVLTPDQVDEIAMFLRALNVRENILSSNKLDDQAMKLRGQQSQEMVRLAMADTEDAIEVLSQGAFKTYDVYPDALKKLRRAYGLEKLAMKSSIGRNLLLAQAKKLKLEAKDLIVAEKS